MRLRSSVLSVDWPVLASAVGETGLGGAVCTVGCGIQLDLGLADERGLYVGGQPAGPDGVGLLRCLRKCDGLQSSISSRVRSYLRKKKYWLQSGKQKIRP
jgi:hypothetical protein